MELSLLLHQRAGWARVLTPVHAQRHSEIKLGALRHKERGPQSEHRPHAFVSNSYAKAEGSILSVTLLL